MDKHLSKNVEHRSWDNSVRVGVELEYLKKEEMQ